MKVIKEDNESHATDDRVDSSDDDDNLGRSQEIISLENVSAVGSTN